MTNRPETGSECVSRVCWHASGWKHTQTCFFRLYSGRLFLPYLTHLVLKRVLLLRFLSQCHPRRLQNISHDDPWWLSMWWDLQSRRKHSSGRVCAWAVLSGGWQLSRGWGQQCCLPSPLSGQVYGHCYCWCGHHTLLTPHSLGLPTCTRYPWTL